MTDAADRAASIQENATGPKRVKGDEGEFEEHSIEDQIMADRYLTGRSAVDASQSRGIRLMKVKPPGAA